MAVWALPLIAALAQSCGFVKLGGTPNDPVPSGTLVAQGPFASLNGWSVTGTAAIYSQGGDAFVVRLGGITVTPQTGLQVVVIANSATALEVPLRSTSGSQNYSFTYTPPAGGTGIFNQVNIHSVIGNRDYGQALLIQQ
jgi:hypothetical protein